MSDWIERYHGSHPQKGWMIVGGGEEIVYLGESVSSEQVSKIVAAHNARVHDLSADNAISPTQGADAQTFVGKWRDVIKNMPDTYTQGADGESLRPVASDRSALIRSICDAIRAADDKSVDEANYMLDSDDCIKLIETFATRDAAPSKAISDVLAERERQDAQWGGQDHDDQHTKADWQNYIYRQHYAASSFCGTPEQYRVRLVKIAALAVAAIESIDRAAASAPREEKS